MWVWNHKWIQLLVIGLFSAEFIEAIRILLCACVYDLQRFMRRGARVKICSFASEKHKCAIFIYGHLLFAIPHPPKIMARVDKINIIRINVTISLSYLSGFIVNNRWYLVIVTIIHPSKPSINEAIDIKCTFC